MATITMYNDINVDNAFLPVWCMVATGGTTAAAISDPSTPPWVAKVLPSTAAWNSVCFGDKLVVAVAGGPSTKVGYSADGTTWVLGTLTQSRAWQSVCYGNGTFITVCNGAVDTNVSIDGAIWTAGGNLLDVAAWYSVAYGTISNTPTFVTVSNTNSSLSEVSTNNGVSWSRMSNLPSGNWQSVCYGTPTINSSVTPMFLAVSYGSSIGAYSTNGISWTQFSLPNSRNWSCVTYGNGLFVAVAYNTSICAISSDGVNWTEKSLMSVANWNCVSYGISSNLGLGMFVATANTGTNAAVSFDGVLWVNKAQLNAAYTFQCYCPFPWNSGDLLVVQNNATITVNTNQNKFWKTITGTYGTLRINNQGNTTTGNYFQMGRVTAATANAITVGSGLFSIDIDGDWISIGTGNNSINQSFTVPFTEYIPMIEVETSTPGIYEVWCNVSAAPGPYNKIFGKDGLDWVGNGNRGNYFVQTPTTNPIAQIILTSGVATNGSYYITYDANTNILPGANIIGTGIPVTAVVNRIVSSTRAELNIPATATNTGLSFTVYNPFRSQFTSTINVGDGTNGNLIPAGRNVRCANLMVSDSSPANIASTSHQTDAYIDMSNACPISAQTCLFGDLYLYINQASSAFFRDVGFSYQFLINECYSVDFNMVGIAATPAYWYYSAKWICRDQRWGLTPPKGYTAPGFGNNMLWSYIHNSRIANLHIVLYSPALVTAAQLLGVSFMNDAVWSNIRISCLWNTKVQYGLNFSDSCFRNQITNLQIYGINPMAINLSSDNNFIGVEYSLSMNSTIQAFKTTYRIADDPATDLPLVDNTKYYFKLRSFRSWMDRSLYYDSNEYSATPFQGGWQFPDYVSIRPTETIARSVTLDWVNRSPSPGQVLYEIYRSTDAGFTDRTPANRVFATLTAATVTCAQGVKIHTVSNGVVIIMTFSSSAKTITRSGSTPGSWVTDGFAVGDLVFINGSYANNGTKTITVLTATVMTVTETLYDEVSGPTQIIAFSRITSKSSSIRIFTFAIGKTITVSGTGANFSVDSFAVGDVVDITGSRTFNNGTFTINTVAATILTFNEPMVAEVTPNSTSAVTTRIFTFASATKTLTASGSSPGSFITDGHFVGDTVYVANSVSNPGPFTINTLTATVMTFNEAVVNETAPAGTIVYRLIIITLRAPIVGTRYYYRFRKYNFNSIATLSCSSPGFFLTTNRQTTGTNTATLTTAVAHGFIVGQSVKVDGLNEAAYRGTFTVTAVGSTTTFSYAISHANESTADTLGRVSSADIKTTYRAVNNNVATLTTNINHLFTVNQSVVVTGMTDTDYNGTYKITSVPSATTFTYVLTHADEGSTTDTAGIIKNITLFSAINTTTRQVTTATSVSAAGKTMTFNKAAGTIVLSSSDWPTDGFLIWDTITITGSAAGNNGTYTIKTIATVTLTIVESFANNETGNGVTVITVTGQPMAKLTTVVNNGYVFGQTITVTGINDSAYNGTFAVRSAATNTVQYPVVRANEASTPDNAGKITTPAYDFSNVYFLSGFRFDNGSTYITNLVNNIYNSMFAPGVIISGRGITAGTKVVTVSPSGREMTIDTPTATSSDTIFSTTFASAKRSTVGTTATIVTTTAHTMTIGDKIRLTGMTDPTYNGTYVITYVPSNTRICFTTAHGAEVEVIDTTGVIRVIDLVLTIPAQVGLAVYGAVGVTGGIEAGTTVTSYDSSSMVTLSQIPDVATQFTNVFFQTFNESAELTAVPNYYVNSTNFCFQNRTMGTTWAVTNATVSGTDTYASPTINDWATATLDQITASAGGGYIKQTINGLIPSTQYTASIWIRADQTQAIPNGVAGSITFGTTTTPFTATNDIKRWSATASTGAGVTSLDFIVTITTISQIIHIGDAMVNLGATPQAPITTTTTAVELFPAASQLAQLRAYCRPYAYCGTTGNQGVEVNIGTIATGEFFAEIYVSTTPGFTPSAATLAASTYAVDTAHFYLYGQSSRNKFLTINKLYGGGAAPAALGVFYLTTTASNNVFQDCTIDVAYCSHATIPLIYILAGSSANNNLFHNIDFGRIRSYFTSNILYQAAALNSVTGNIFQDIRCHSYDTPISNMMLNSPMKGFAGARAVPAVGATTYAIGSTSDGILGAGAAAVYGNPFYDLYQSDTEGLLCAVMTDCQTNKPYTVKAGKPTFTNTGKVELINAFSVATVNRARSNGVATIQTLLPHDVILGDEIIVSGLGGTGYNGTQVVTLVADSTHFSYVNAGSNETETGDTTGIVTVGTSIEFVWPYKILGVAGFQKLFPKILYTDLGTQTDIPEALRIDVSIKTASTWSAYVEATPANLFALSVSPTVGFYFKFKLTALPFMRYGTMTYPMYAGDTIKGALSGVTAVVVKDYNFGATGTLILSKISGTFFPGELIVNNTTDTRSTTLRTVTTNVATLTTSTAHGMNVGYWVTITGMTDATYNGTFVVASVPSATTFTYALTHANEGSTADTAGTILLSPNRATNVVTNGFAMGPSFTSNVNVVQFFTSYINQNTVYPSYSTTLILTQLSSGSTIGIFDNNSTLLEVGTSTTSYTYVYGWFGTVLTNSYKVRKAGYAEINVNWSTASTSQSIPVFQTQYRAVADASAYTGIAIDGTARTITVTSTHSLLELYDYAQYWSCLPANISYQIPLTISVDSKTVIVTSGWVITVSNNASLADTTRDISGDVGAIAYTAGGAYLDSNEVDWEASGSFYYASNFTHTISDGTNSIVGAEVTYFDGTNNNRTYNSTSKLLSTSLSSNGSGLVTGYAVFKIDSNTYTGHYVKVRQYGFLTSSGTRTVNGIPITDTITLTADNFATDSEVAVAAFTGIALDYVAKTITVTTNHTLVEIYEYIKYSDALSVNMDELDTISTSDGSNYLLTVNWGINIADNITVTATGKKLVMSGTGTYNLNISGQFIGTMADAVKIRVPVTLTGITIGSRCRIEKLSDGTTIYNGEPISSSLTTYYEYTGDTAINVIVRKSSAASRYLPYQTGSTITSTGASISIAQIFDTFVLDSYGAIASDWTVDVSLKTIKHSSGTTVYTVTQLYSWLLDSFDELTYLSNQIPISASTPTEFNLINGWFIDDHSFKYLTSGAITSIGQTGEIQVLKLDNITNDPVGGDIGKKVQDDGVEVGTLINYEIDTYGDNTGKWYVRTGSATAIADNSVITISSGTGSGTASAASLNGESIWSNIFTLGSLVPSTILDVYQNDTQITPWWSTGHIDILVKVKESGTKIDSSKLTILARTYGSLYDHFVLDASSGRNPVPLAAFTDGNNQTSLSTVSNYSGLTFTFGYVSKDLGNGNGPQPYACIIDCHNHTISEIYEYLKYATRSGSELALNGVTGEFYIAVGDIYFDYTNKAGGNFVEGELINGTGGAYGHLVALSESSMILRNVHGTFINGMAISGTTNGATAQVNNTVITITPQKQAPFGTFAGGQFFGVLGIWFENVAAADTNNYQLIDSLGATQIPASSINITISDLHVGDRVGVFRTVGDSNIVDKSIYTSDSSANISTSNTFTVTTPIASDTPDYGSLYVVNRDEFSGIILDEFIYPYSSWTGSVFTLDNVTLAQNFNSHDTAFVPYISTQATSTSVSVNVKYISGRYVTVRVRKKGIIPFIIKSLISSTGLSISAIRTTDNIVGVVPSGISDDYITNCFLKKIIHVGGSTVYTVNNLYSWLMDLHEEIEHLTHDLPMSAQTPSEYTVASGWYIDETAMTYLKSGAITTSGWDATINIDGIRILTFTSNPNTQMIDINQEVIYAAGGPTDSGKLISYDNNSKEWWVRVDSFDDVFSDTSHAIRINGTGNGGTLAAASETGDDQFSNIYTLGTIQPGTNVYVYQNDVKINSWWPSGHIDIITETRDEGNLIDNGNLAVFARKYGTLYDHFIIDASTGRNPVPLAAFSDINNQTDESVVATYSDITFTFGHTVKDINNGNGVQPYDCIINCAGRSVKQVYEYCKYLTRAGSTATLNGVNGEYYIGVGDIKLDYTDETNGPFIEGSAISSSSGGSGYIVSVENNGSEGNLLVRNVHGVFLATDIITSGSVSATIYGEPKILTPSKQSPFGTFAGGKFFGARGIWLDNILGVDTNNFQLTDSLGISQSAPAFISVSVAGLESGDIVSVFRTTGNNKIIDKTYLHSHTTANSTASSTWTVDPSTPIPSDTPSTGYIRILKTSTNIEERIVYTSWVGNVFTLSTSHSGDYNSSDTAYVPFIDIVASSSTVSVSFSFVTERYIYALVRHKGIVPFDVKGQITSVGYSLTAIRTTDSIVS
jgi:hypothetical protein